MSKQEDFHQPKKLSEKLRTKLEYQNKPKQKEKEKEISYKSETHNSARYPAKPSDILAYYEDFR